MGVNIGGLDYTSTLDNSDFQAKSLQDIKLIETRLRLTGDTSGIDKYDKAITDALNSEATLRENLAKILADAQIQTQAFVKEITDVPSKTVFSDSAAEVKAYQDSLNGLESGAAVVTELNAQLEALAVTQNELNDSLKAGTITQEAYDSANEDIIAEQTRLFQNIQTVTDAYEKNTIVQKQNADQAKQTTISLEEQIGIINELKISLEELNGMKASAGSVGEIAQINKQIDETTATLAQFGNAGKQGFDDLGNKITQVVPKANAFEKAIDKATSVTSIGAKFVTQFTRQIIGLGVGFLSLEIGAKAIQSLIEYIQNLDYFTGRLDVAKQTMLAFNEVQDNAAKSSAASLTNLRVLADATADVTLSMQDRVSAAEELKKEFPTEFANSTALQLVNGDLAKSYDDVKKSIIAQAVAAANLTKVTELEGQKGALIAQQFEIQAKANIDKANAKGVAASTTSLPGGGGQFIPSITPAQQQKGIQEIADYQKQKLNPAIKALDDTIDAVISSAGGAGVLAKTISGANKVITGSLAQFDTLIAKAASGGDKNDLEALKKGLQAKIDALAPDDPQIADIGKRLQAVDALLKKYDFKAPAKVKDNSADSLLASQTSVLEKTAALKARYASKDATADQQALDQIKANFKAQNEAIDAQNKKLADDLKNKKITPQQAAAKGLVQIPRLSQSDLDSALAGEAGAQSLTQTQAEIDKEKVLFQEYQDFKTKAGTDAANQLYGNELKGFTSYVAYLKSLQPSESDLTSADPYVKHRASALNDYLKTILPQAEAQELKQQQAHLQNLILQDQTYQQQRATLITVSEQDIQTLQAAGFTDQAKQQQQNLDDQLTALDVANFKKLDLYKEYFDGLLVLTQAQAQNDLTLLGRQADSDVVNGKITIEAYLQIVKQLQQASVALKNSGTPQTLDEIGSAFSSLSGGLTDVNSNLGSFVGAAGQAFTSIGKITALQNSLSDSTISSSDKLKDNISLYTQGAQAALSIVDNLIQAAKARKQAEEDYYNSVITFQQQYNVALDEQIRLQYQTAQGSIFYTDTAKELSGAVLAYDAAAKQYQESLAALQKGQAITGTKKVASGTNIATDAAAGAVLGSVIPGLGTAVGAAAGAVVGGLVGLFGGKKVVNVLAPLLQTYPQLIAANGEFNDSLAKTLVANNQVDDSTKVLLNNTIAYYDEEKTALDQITQTLTDLVGQLGSNISNALVSAFENGTDAAVAFKNTVSDILSQIIQQDLFVAVFGQQLDALQTKLKSDVFANDGNTQAEIIADITDFYKTAQGLVPDYVAGLAAAKSAGNQAGLDLFPTGGSAGSSATLSGGISASITEDTASILAGTLKGIQLNTYTTNNILQTYGITFSQMLMLAQDSVNQLELIQANTLRGANTLDANLPAMLIELQGINKGTADNLGYQLRAAGKFGF